MPGDIHARLAALPAFPTLTGARVRLREPRTDDIDGLFALFADPRVMRYWSSAPMRSRMQAEGKVEEMREAFERRESLDWVVADRRDDLAIGSCTLFRFDARHRRAEIGYALRSALWGRGLASDAVAMALDWGFRTLGLHRIEADIDPRNEASRALLLRLGFSSEGVLRERFFVGDQATDSELFGLLAQEWHGRRR
ncbi:GNAT family N-acetyltransferase [Luteimonas viscosa]|uniref:GNAT family N-acetyltransferase n=1 Tax=Luteimonas viscosa TaxID=1132694 RepID=A0A5D4XMI6_9GAMM|nr:GNAT family N-acetyltransferase [Luteimonas viscosa]TYT25769.1 GNAT family N-acetyltransferase [Luteimonas viscosa]